MKKPCIRSVGLNAKLCSVGVAGLCGFVHAGECLHTKDMVMVGIC